MCAAIEPILTIVSLQCEKPLIIIRCISQALEQSVALQLYMILCRIVIAIETATARTMATIIANEMHLTSFQFFGASRPAHSHSLMFSKLENHLSILRITRFSHLKFVYINRIVLWFGLANVSFKLLFVSPINTHK